MSQRRGTPMDMPPRPKRPEPPPKRQGKVAPRKMTQVLKRAPAPGRGGGKSSQAKVR